MHQEELVFTCAHSFTFPSSDFFIALGGRTLQVAALAGEGKSPSERTFDTGHDLFEDVYASRTACK